MSYIMELKKIITTHIAFDSAEAVERILETTTLNINSFSEAKIITRLFN